MRRLRYANLAFFCFAATTLGGDDVSDPAALREAHEAGRPIVVRASSAAEIKEALGHPEVATALVPPERRDLLDVDLRELTYGP